MSFPTHTAHLHLIRFPYSLVDEDDGQLADEGRWPVAHQGVVAGTVSGMAGGRVDNSWVISAPRLGTCCLHPAHLAVTVATTGQERASTAMQRVLVLAGVEEGAEGHFSPFTRG
jgi:hypothetical protein